MKNYTKSAIGLLFAGAFALTSCFNSDADSSVDETVKVAIANEARVAANDDATDAFSCLYNNRKTESTLTREIGHVMQLNGETGPFVISIPRTSGRIDACNFPENMKVDGMTVVFSADLKEIYDYERWAARPAVLLNIVASSTPQ